LARRRIPRLLLASDGAMSRSLQKDVAVRSWLDQSGKQALARDEPPAFFKAPRVGQFRRPTWASVECVQIAAKCQRVEIVFIKTDVAVGKGTAERHDPIGIRDRGGVEMEGCAYIVLVLHTEGVFQEPGVGPAPVDYARLQPILKAAGPLEAQR